MPVTFVTVKLPDGALIHLDIDLKTSVEEFRTILAPKSGVKRHRQRLVFAGRLLQDGRNLEAYGIERNSTVHLLHGGDGGGMPAVTAGGTMGSTMGGMQAIGAKGMDISTMPPHLGTLQNHLLHNPDILQQMLESPAMQSLLNDHDFMRSLLKMDPRSAKLMENCPEVQQMLHDAEFMGQATEALRNPVHVRDVLRSTDLSMTKLESLAGGSFDVLRQMCEDIERPLDGAILMPPSRSNTIGSSAGGFAMAIGGGAGEPDEEDPGKEDGAAGGSKPPPEWLGTFDTNAMASMMQDHNMQQLLSQLVQTMPGPTAKPSPDDPFLDPGFIGQMFHAQTLDSMTKLQQAIELLSMTGDAGAPPVPAAEAPGAPSPKQAAAGGGAAGARARKGAIAKPAAPAGVEAPGSEPSADSPFVLSGLNPKSPACNFKESFALFLQAEQESPEVRYKGQLQSMVNMGFTDKEACIQALHNCDGNMSKAVEELIQQGKGK